MGYGSIMSLRKRGLMVGLENWSKRPDTAIISSRVLGSRGNTSLWGSMNQNFTTRVPRGPKAISRGLEMTG
jgi:hypothetical protein